MDNGKEVFLAAVRGERTSRPAVASVNQTGTYEQMEALGVKWPDANFDAKLMARLAFGAYSILGFDAVRVPFCQTIEEEAFGCEVKPGDETNLPSIAVHPFDLKHAPQFPEDFLKRGRVPLLIDAVKDLKQQVGDKVAVIGGVIGPFTIVGEMIGISKFLVATLKSPSDLKPFLEVTAKGVAQLANAMVEAGADVICIEDMLASMDMISPKAYRELAAPWEAEVIAGLKVPTILHICGRVDPILPDMISTGAAALSFELKTNIAAAKKAIEESGRKVGLIGGVATMEHLYFGDADMVRKAALESAESGYDMIAPTCSIPPATSTASLKAMTEAVKNN